MFSCPGDPEAKYEGKCPVTSCYASGAKNQQGCALVNGPALSADELSVLFNLTPKAVKADIASGMNAIRHAVALQRVLLHARSAFKVESFCLKCGTPLPHKSLRECGNRSKCTQRLDIVNRALSSSFLSKLSSLELSAKDLYLMAADRQTILGITRRIFNNAEHTLSMHAFLCLRDKSELSELSKWHE